MAGSAGGSVAGSEGGSVASSTAGSAASSGSADASVGDGSRKGSGGGGAAGEPLSVLSMMRRRDSRGSVRTPLDPLLSELPWPQLITRGRDS